MATTSLWKIDSRVDHVVNYATDKDKTEKQFFIIGINCKVEDAVKQMEFVKTLYGKEDGILAFHGYQSFDKGEVTPEIAHEIEVRLAEEMWEIDFRL